MKWDEYDFNGIANPAGELSHRASGGLTVDATPPDPPSGTEFANSDVGYNGIAADDALWGVTNAGAGTGKRPFNLFRFYVPPRAGWPIRLQFSATGHNEPPGDGPALFEGFFWNRQTGLWESIGSHSNGVDETITGTKIGQVMRYYREPGTYYIYTGLVAQLAGVGPASQLHTNYVKLRVATWHGLRTWGPGWAEDFAESFDET